MKHKLPDINQEFSEWYHEIVAQAELADHAPVRGCMVVRPYGCALWERIQAIVDQKIKATGHHNALFPLFIPESFLKKEADHVAGFSPELAVVTHAGGKELEEPLVVRPTSETIIHYMFARWLTSWRDLPLKINQWANVVRWEMRPRAFLRTTEFWWQEGHTAHETAEEADEETHLMINEYRDLIENYLAIPVFCGKKSENEKFAGALMTLTLEAIMPDGKALQMCTSHRISQTFAHAFDMKFQDRQGALSYPHLTSWAVTTRAIGALVMAHGDQKGLVIPPRIAPIQVVIIPISNDANRTVVMEYSLALKKQLDEAGVRTQIDYDEQKTPGAKFYHWELRGIPLRIEIGQRDIEKNAATVVERVEGKKQSVGIDGIVDMVQKTLEATQEILFRRAQERRAGQEMVVEMLNTIISRIENHRGYFKTSWCKECNCETVLKEHKASIRCLLDTPPTYASCFSCGKDSITDIIVARSY